MFKIKDTLLVSNGYAKCSSTRRNHPSPLTMNLKSLRYTTLVFILHLWALVKLLIDLHFFLIALSVIWTICNLLLIGQITGTGYKWLRPLRGVKATFHLFKIKRSSLKKIAKNSWHANVNNWVVRFFKYSLCISADHCIYNDH